MTLTLERLPLVVWSLVGLLIAGSAAMCVTSPGSEAESEREAVLDAARLHGGAIAPLPASVAVDVLEVRRRIEPLEIELACTLAPLRSVTLAAEVEGRVVEVAVDEHHRVEAGEVLVRLEADLLRAALKRAEAALVRARASDRLARIELDRQKGLTRQSVGSAAELNRAESEERSGYAQVADAEAALVEARTRLAKAEIAAPFAGVVKEIEIEPGSYLRLGEPVVEVIDLASVEVEVGVSDREVVALAAGDPAELVVDVYPGDVFAGEIVSVGRDVDDLTKKYPVVVHVPNAEGLLLPGMLGELRLRLAAERPVVLIPRAAVQREFEIDFVWVVRERDGLPRAERRRIEARPVPFHPELLEVMSGLVDGERIAISGMRVLREDLPLKIGSAS